VLCTIVRARDRFVVERLLRYAGSGFDSHDLSFHHELLQRRGKRGSFYLAKRA
jgi:hypothetical protein